MSIFAIFLSILILQLSTKSLCFTLKQKDYNDTINDNESCKKCRSIVHSLIQQRRTGATRDEMYTAFNNLCNEYMYAGAEYCAGLVNIELDTALYIIDNKQDLDPATPCASYLQYLGCNDPLLGKWNVSIPDYTYDATTNLHRLESGVTKEPNLKKILHLTDFHFDPLYKPGSNAACTNVPICCQEKSGIPSKPEDAAGYWGSYNLCDVPWHSVLAVLNHISSQHGNIDYIYFTGDIISHTGWATSKENNSEYISQMYRQLETTFGNITIIPVLGNHEPHPTDFFSPSNVTDNLVTSQWLFNLIANEWSTWLPSETQATILKGGFYTFLLQPGLRIIALNSNVCYINNFWLIYNDKDPFGQLQWFTDVLYEAEKQGEYVHVLSHIPAGESLCSKHWIRQFNRIIKRFSRTIKAQINGHTHLDELRVFYNDSNPKQVTNVGFNGGSVTTFVGYNPNYKIYDVDFKTFDILDYEQWIFNLTEANLNPNKSPKWYKQYSFLDAYNLPNLSLENIGQLINSLSTNNTLLYQYFRHQVRDSDSHLRQGCNEDCLKKKLCRITAIEVDDASKCI